MLEAPVLGPGLFCCRGSPQRRARLLARAHRAGEARCPATPNGHTIKHKKGALDAKRGKVFTKLIREMTIAARIGGGDPDANPRLRTAVDKAKALEHARRQHQARHQEGHGRARGRDLRGDDLEGYGPGGVAILVEGMTDNRNRTVAEIRHIFTKHGGNLGGAGSVAYMFKPKGVIAIAAEKTTEDKLMEIALEAGADDIVTEAEGFEVYTTPHALRGGARGHQEGRASSPTRPRSGSSPTTTIALEGTKAQQMLKLDRGPRRPRRRPERLGQLRHLREGDGGGGRQLGLQA